MMLASLLSAGVALIGVAVAKQMKSWNSSSSFRLRVRRGFGDRLLRWVEPLPQFRSGPIAHLQRIRQRQLQEQDDLREALKIEAPPELVLTHLCLTEVFFVEDLDSLKKQLHGVFPDDPYKLNFTFDPFERSESLNSGSWSAIGTIAAKRRFSPFRSAVLKDVPSGVQSIDVQLYRPLSSAWVLTFNFKLESDASACFREAITKPKPGIVTLASWLPTNKYLWPHSSSPAENVTREAVEECLCLLKRECSRFVRKHFRGFFAQQGSEFFPAIEQIWIRTTVQVMEEEAKRSRALVWSRMLKVNRDTWRAFFWKEWSATVNITDGTTRLTRYSPEELPSEESHMEYHAGPNLAASLALLNVVMENQKHIAVQRRVLFALRRKSRSASRLAQVLTFHQEAIRRLHSLKRLALEKDQAHRTEWYINFDSFVSEQNPESPPKLGEEIERWFSSTLIFTRSYAELLLDLTSTESTNQNLSVMLTLQRRMYVFAALALVVGVCALVGLPTIQLWCTWIMRHIRTVVIP